MSDILPINGETNTEAAARVNNDASRYQPVPSKNLGAWAALGGRLLKLEGFVASPSGGNAQILGMQSAVKMTLMLLANPSTEIYVNPGHPHRQLLDGLVSINVLTAQDVSDLVDWYGRKLPLVTPEDVAAAITADALATAKNARIVAEHTRHSLSLAAINAAETIADLPEPITP